MSYVSRYAGMTPDEIEASLYEDIAAAVQRRYSLLPDDGIMKRVRAEWAALRSSGTVLEVAALYELTCRLKERGFPFWLCGACGSSFIFYLLGMTSGNPLPPHYYCPQCRQVSWADSQADGFDLPENRVCESDGILLLGDGHNIPWQTLWSGGPLPDCRYEMRLAGPAYEELLPFLKNHWLRLLNPEARLVKPHPSIHAVRFSRLFLMFTIDPKDVSPDFFGTELNAACAAPALLDSEALIDPDRDGEGISIPAPDRFADLVYACGLCHSTGAWDDGAAFMVQRMGYTLSDLIAFRDDVFSYLLSHGFPEDEARQGMTQARKGRGFPRITGEMKAARDKWVLSRCASVQYLFPKAHAVEWILYRLKAAGVKTHFTTSYALLRRILCGAGVYLLAGGPGMGKTAFALYLAKKLAGEDQKRVAVFVPNGGRGTVTARGILPPPEENARGSVCVYDGGNLDAIEEQLRAGDGFDFAVIDPLRQLFPRKRMSAAQAAAVMERLRELAVSTGIPILAAAGLTRNPERRRDHRPRIADVPLMDGTLPYTEAVLLLYRDGYYDPEADPALACCDVQKYPGSVLRSVQLTWNRQRASFEDGIVLGGDPGGLG